MSEWFAKTTMPAQGIYLQCPADFKALRKGDIVYAKSSVDINIGQITTLPEERLGGNVAMRFTGITKSHERNRIQEMQYEGFIRTMAEMMEKYQTGFSG